MKQPDGTRGPDRICPFRLRNQAAPLKQLHEVGNDLPVSDIPPEKSGGSVEASNDGRAEAGPAGDIPPEKSGGSVEAGRNRDFSGKIFPHSA